MNEFLASSIVGKGGLMLILVHLRSIVYTNCKYEYTNTSSPPTKYPPQLWACPLFTTCLTALFCRMIRIQVEHEYLYCLIPHGLECCIHLNTRKMTATFWALFFMFDNDCTFSWSLVMYFIEILIYSYNYSLGNHSLYVPINTKSFTVSVSIAVDRFKDL